MSWKALRNQWPQSYVFAPSQYLFVCLLRIYTCSLIMLGALIAESPLASTLAVVIVYEGFDLFFVSLSP
jgi:hypothetical protein